MKEYLKGLTRSVSIFVIGVALIAVYKTFDNMSVILSFIGRIIGILSPFVIGLGIAFLLYAPSSRLENLIKRKFPRPVARFARTISVLTVYFALFLILSLLITIALPAVTRSIVSLASSLPGYYDKLVGFLTSLTQRDGILKGFDITKAVHEIYTSYIEPRLAPDAVLIYFRGVMSFTTSLLGFLMSVIISIYMLLSRDSLLNTGKQMLGLFISESRMEYVTHYTRRSCEILYSYFYSQALDAIIVGVLMTVGLLIFGAPNALLLGILIGLLNMIPYFGAIIGGSIAVIITLLSGNVYGAALVTVYIIAAQQIDASLIQPRIAGRTLGVRPIYVLLAITLGGGLFGFWGIFLGVPAIAIVQMLLRDYISYRSRVKKAPIRPSEWSSTGGKP